MTEASACQKLIGVCDESGPVVHEFDLYAMMSSAEEENLVIDTWSHKYAIGYDSDGVQEGTEKKKKKKHKKKHKKKKSKGRDLEKSFMLPPQAVTE